MKGMSRDWLSIWDASNALLLLTDQVKSRLHVVKRDGNATQLKLNQYISQPSTAVLLKDSLVVYSWDEKKLFQFKN